MSETPVQETSSVRWNGERRQTEPAANEAEEVPDFEEIVTAWLGDHPDFFTHHPELVDRLRIPHPCRPAVSLLEYQNRLLRERCQRLHDRLLDLIRIARSNDRLAERVQRLALRLLDGRDGMEELLRNVKAILREEFNADHVAIRLTASATTCLRMGMEFRLPEGVALFEEVLKIGQPWCGRLRPEHAAVLFGDAAAELTASAALVPLSGDDWRGMLALGSRDSERFPAGAGTLFLERIGSLVGQALQTRLQSCRWRGVVDSASIRGGG